jgi:hypothetical protein
VSTEAPAALAARVAQAVEARARLRGRPLRDAIASLAAAAERWKTDELLAAELPAAAGLTGPLVAAALPRAAAALDARAMTALVEREYGAGATARPAPTGPALVAQVVASNVPALALPAIALGCLAGAAVVVKSGRHDRCSAPALVRALAVEDPDLAATIVATYWPGGDRTAEAAAFADADVVVVTGGEAALAAVGGRARRRVVAHGPRTSAAVVAGAWDDALVDAVAFDVALHDQRGCLSPHVVWVVEGALAFAERLAAALDALARRLPPAPAALETRAARRLLSAEAEWTPGGAAWSGPGGTVVYGETAAFRPTSGGRAVRVHPLADVDRLAALVPAGVVECVGLAGREPGELVRALRALGVSRLCPPGRMQEPRLSWPRGQHEPLAALRGRPAPPAIEVET